MFGVGPKQLEILRIRSSITGNMLGSLHSIKARAVTLGVEGLIVEAYHNYIDVMRGCNIRVKCDKFRR